MLTILLNWIYMLFTTFCTGFLFMDFVDRKLQYRMKRLDSVLMSGLVIVSVYAQSFSIFYRVAVEANVIMTLICIAIILVYHKQMFKMLREMWNETSVYKKAVIAVLFLLWAFFSSRGYIYYDSDLYHAQSIRWIEEYGVVKGLGNLHERFAYNSALFPLSALYSLKFLMGYSMHAVNGFIAFILSLTVLDLSKIRKRGRMLLSDYVMLAAVYYLTIIVDEVISPTPDIAVMCVIFYIFIKWLKTLESEDRKNVAPYALLCVVGVYALTLKLTAGLVILLVLKPAYQLVKEKKWKEILLYLFMGLVTAVPWMVRTVIISGWLFYPFPYLDLFSVDWKVRKESVVTDARQIRSWGKGTSDAKHLEWVPGWFGTMLVFSEKIIILADVVSMGIFAVGLLWTLIKKKWKDLDVLAVFFVLVCSYLFWQFSAPLTRYGYAYILSLAALGIGWILTSIKAGRNSKIWYEKGVFWLRDRVLILCIVLYGIYKMIVITDAYIYGARLVEAYIMQEDYGSYEVGAYDLDGVTIYCPLYGDRSGYDPFPAAATERNIHDLELRGTGLKDGFRHK